MPVRSCWTWLCVWLSGRVTAFTTCDAAQWSAQGLHQCSRQRDVPQLCGCGVKGGTNEAIHRRHHLQGAVEGQ